jgi:hypothetical protein
MSTQTAIPSSSPSNDQAAESEKSGESATPKIPKKKVVVIGMMTFAVMNFMTVVSLRGLPAQAEYGLVSIF